MEDELVSATIVDDTSRISYEALQDNTMLSMESPLNSVMVADGTISISLEVLRDNSKLSVEDPTVPGRYLTILAR
jgi:hypothetical protein